MKLWGKMTLSQWTDEGRCGNVWTGVTTIDTHMIHLSSLVQRIIAILAEGHLENGDEEIHHKVRAKDDKRNEEDDSGKG